MTKPAFFLPSLDETARLSLLPGAAEVAVRTALRRPAAVTVPAGTVSDVLVDRATRHPDRPAVIEKSGVVTYRELLERVAELRSLLLGWGCRHGERVAVTGPRGSERIALVLALESLGAVYVPLEADWPANRALEILNQIRAAFLVVHAAGRDSTHQDPDDPLPAVAARRAGIPVRHVPTASPEDTPCTAWPVRRPEAAEPRYVIHTSGSSGRPKGVVVEHRGLMNHLWDKVRGLELGPDDVIAFSAPTSYVISVWQMLAPILVGARVAVVDEDDVRYPKPLMAAVRRTEVSILEVVPAVLEWMVKLGQRSPEDPLLPRLRCLISTGAELRPQLAAEALSAFPGVTLVNAYGASECSDDVAEHVVTAADVNKPRMPVGRPIANAVLYLLVNDGGAWRAAGPGEEGELWVGGLPVGAGYAYDAERTRRSFVADELDPDSGTGRLYRTGDLARFEDGVAYCLGRADRQVKIGGMRIELDDIEITLTRHPGIEHCAVVAAGDGDDRYVAACFSSRREIPHSELREFALRYLPSGMIPRRWVQLDAFPRLDRGKTDYRAIAESLS